MSPVDVSTIMALLQSMQSDLRETKDNVREIIRRLGRIEQSVAHMAGAQVDQEIRIDRLAERVERLESRLELRDAP